MVTRSGNFAPGSWLPARPRLIGHQGSARKPHPPLPELAPLELTKAERCEITTWNAKVLWICGTGKLVRSAVAGSIRLVERHILV